MNYYLRGRLRTGCTAQAKQCTKPHPNIALCPQPRRPKAQTSRLSCRAEGVQMLPGVAPPKSACTVHGRTCWSSIAINGSE
eukprot:7603423-Alexandrium_andersonii.AAC.1